MRKLLRDLAEFSQESSFRAMDILLHQPDFLRWILQEVKWGEGLSRWLGEWSASGYKTMEAGLESALGMPPSVVGNSVFPVLQKLADLKKLLQGGDWPRALRTTWLAIYDDRELEESRGEVEAAKSIQQYLQEAEEGTARELGFTGWVELLGSLGGSWTKEKEMGAVEIEGWLDAAGEDANVLILAGMNEGMLPRGPATDSMLAESAKRKLGLPDRDFLFARDLCLLYGMEAGRKKGGLVVLTAQTGQAGDPLRPSRLLFRVPDGALAKRVEELAREVEPKETGNRREVLQKYKLRIPQAPGRAKTDLLRVTDFSAFLVCPLRFYLSRRLGWRLGDEPTASLDGARFGTWMHDVLSTFGDDRTMRECADAEQIYELVREVWDAKFLPWQESGILRLHLDLQRDSGRERLKRFAEVQAEMVRQGWRIRSTETELGEERVLPPIEMKK